MLFNKCLIGSYTRSKHSRFQTNKYGCYLCWTNLSSTAEYQSHMKNHLEKVKLNEFNASWRKLGDLESIGFDVKVNHSDLTLNLKNNSKSAVRIRQVSVYNTLVTLDFVEPDVFPIVLEIDGELTLKRDVKLLCNHNHVAIVYESISCGISEAIQSYRVQKEETEMKIKEEVKLPTMTSAKISNSNTQVRPKNHGQLELGKLQSYDPSVEIKSLFKANFKQNESLTGNEVKILKTITQFKGPLTASNYFDMQVLMVQIEDYDAQLSVMRSAKWKRSLVKLKGNEYVLKLDHHEGRPLFLVAGDRIFIKKENNNPRTYGVVQFVSSKEIQMKLQTSSGIAQQQPIYSIHFEINRLTSKLQRLALDAAKKLDIIDLLFPQENQITLLPKPVLPKLEIHNKLLKGDARQIEAVHHIVAGTAYPLPYILIGYPGTGKTATIVESIYQLWKINTKNRILVCAQSNAACDEIAHRLMSSIGTRYGQQYEIIRLFAASVRKSCTNEDIMENSNFEERSIPCLRELYKYRIIISTLTVSGRLLQANMEPNHFTHLFIDECESASEAFTLLPIALCSSAKKINPHIVLSGDPYQLGPVVRHKIAQEMTMDISMFQRLSNNPLYQKKKNSYDPRIICKLRNNYRSHPDLVAMPNELFYNNEMNPCAKIEKIRWLSELDFLPKKGFPILLEHVDGIPETKENCSSWFNDMEKESVLYYIKKLLQNEPHKIKQSDIGVIAAYKRQVIHIVEALEENNYNEVEVGTVENFQGREKLIIIISTVRNGSLGFLKQRERINVMLTRAIGLLIVIGHTKSLKKNDNWDRIVSYTSNECGGEMVAVYDYGLGDYRC